MFGSQVGTHRGTLYIRIGPMFCGKSTWLNSELTQLADTGFNVIKITHAIDNREGVAKTDRSGSTHNSSYKYLTDKIKCERVTSLMELDVSNYHAIGVDESQFFPDLYETVKFWVEILGKHVRVVGLDGDSQKLKFGQTLDLIPLCDEVVKLVARCVVCLDHLRSCNFQGNIDGILGPFTKRLENSGSQILVGGSDKYIPVCRFHHTS